MRFSVLLPLLCIVSACPLPEGSECQLDADCPIAQGCVLGQCRAGDAFLPFGDTGNSDACLGSHAAPSTDIRCGQEPLVMDVTGEPPCRSYEVHPGQAPFGTSFCGGDGAGLTREAYLEVKTFGGGAIDLAVRPSPGQSVRFVMVDGNVCTDTGHCSPEQEPGVVVQAAMCVRETTTLVWLGASSSEPVTVEVRSLREADFCR